MFGGACSRYSLHTKSLAEVRGGVLILIWEPPSKVAAGPYRWAGPLTPALLLAPIHRSDAPIVKWRHSPRRRDPRLMILSARNSQRKRDQHTVDLPGQPSA
jgi:hypothetical protein